MVLSLRTETTHTQNKQNNLKMATLVIKEKVLDEIKSNQVLFGKVALAMNLTVRSMFDLMRKPNACERLATATVLKALKSHLNITDDTELLEEIELMPSS